LRTSAARAGSNERAEPDAEGGTTSDSATIGVLKPTDGEDCSVDWETDRETGNIIVHPLTGYATMLAMGMSIVVKLDYLRPGDEFQKPSGRAQLVLTPAQAIELATALTDAAGKIDLTTPTSPPS
jgi:hypothetical protein